MNKILIRHAQTFGQPQRRDKKGVISLTPRGVGEMERPRAALAKIAAKPEWRISTARIAVPDNSWGKMSALLLSYSMEEIEEIAEGENPLTHEELINFRVDSRLEEPNSGLSPQALSVALRTGKVAAEAFAAADGLMADPLPEDVWIVGAHTMAAMHLRVEPGRQQPLMPPSSSQLGGNRPNPKSLVAAHGEGRIFTL